MKSIGDLVKNITDGASSAHAYIIEGRAGKARDEFIADLVSGLQCRTPKADGTACGSCDSCVQIAAGSNPDIVQMQKSGKSSYRTEDAAAFMERLNMSAYGRYLIGIIDGAESMSEVVQNKLLKTLEEPAADVVLLLTTARSDELLDTVKSRCSLIRIQEYEGYSDEDEDEASGDYMEAVFMLLSQRTAFYEFRDFLDKHVKSPEDAQRLIALAEEKLRAAMAEGKAAKLCADRIEMAEKASADISRGMDKAKALKRLYLNYSDNQAHKA